MVGRATRLNNMMSISTIGSGQAHYYTSLVREDYYLEGGESPGRWGGRGLAAQGLESGSRVEARDLHNFVRGYSRSGDALVQNAGSKKRQQGWDFCFSAPKSVSVLWALSDSAKRVAIEAAVLDAANAAMTRFEREHAWSGRGPGGRVRESARTIDAYFLHTTSRAGDMNLHVHVVKPNLGQRPDGTWGGLRKFPYEEKVRYGSLFRTDLRRRLESLGVATELDPRGAKKFGFRVPCIPREVEKHFSRRRKAIESAMSERGEQSARFAERAALRTRPRKRVESRAALTRRWRAEAKSLGFDLENVFRRGPVVAAPASRPVVRSQLERVRNVGRSPGTQERSANPEVKRLRALVDSLRELKEAGNRVTLVDRPDAAIGKSDLNRILGAGLSKPRRVFALSPTRLGSVCFQQRTGRETQTVSAFFKRVDLGGLRSRIQHDVGQLARAAINRPTRCFAGVAVRKGDAIVVDAAHGLSLKAVSRLVDIATENQARLILLGDSSASPSAFKSILRAVPPMEQLADSGRPAWLQEAHSRSAVGDRDGARKACGMGLVREEVPSTESRNSRLVDVLVGRGDRTVVVTGNRAEAANINALAQADLPRRFGARAVQHRGGCLMTGDRVLLQRTSERLGVRAGDLGTIESIRGSILSSPELVIRLDRPRRTGLLRASTVRVPLADYPHVSLGFAVTARQAEGARFDKTLVAEARDGRGYHTQLTRHETEVRFFAVTQQAQEWSR